MGSMQVNPLRVNLGEQAEHTPLGNLLTHSALVSMQLPLERKYPCWHFWHYVSLTEF